MREGRRSDPQFHAIRPTRASSDVIEQIRVAILSGKMQPGDRLPTERELASQFGVSRVTIRDALRALEAGGLVRVKVGSGGGPYVAEPDVNLLSSALANHLHLRGTTFRELAEARMALETTAARLAATRANETDLDRLRAALDAPPNLPAGPGTAASSVDFHTALVTAAHNEALLAMFAALRVLTHEAIGLVHARLRDTPEVARRVHGMLYDAVVHGDAEHAVAVMREHMEDFAARVERARQAEEVTGLSVVGRD